MNDALAIQANELTKIYGSGNTEVVAMRDASVRVRRGEVVALLGPSGAGKSTFLTAVGLITPLTSGRVTIGGKLVLDGPYAQTNLQSFRRKHIGYVFQKSNLIPFLSACENVQIALELSGYSSGAARRRRLSSCSTILVSRIENAICRRCFPGGSNNEWPSPVPLLTSQVFFWPTSQRLRLTAIVEGK